MRNSQATKDRHAGLSERERFLMAVAGMMMIPFGLLIALVGISEIQFISIFAGIFILLGGIFFLSLVARKKNIVEPEE